MLMNSRIYFRVAIIDKTRTNPVNDVTNRVYVYTVLFSVGFAYFEKYSAYLLCARPAASVRPSLSSVSVLIRCVYKTHTYYTILHLIATRVFFRVLNLTRLIYVHAKRGQLEKIYARTKPR